MPHQQQARPVVVLEAHAIRKVRDAGIYAYSAKKAASTPYERPRGR
jgi:hypothetical protein